ncbi:MAG: zinc ABC transporter substrate-binding protein [Gemmatimonadetes bacterium]|nr:zinc ABC transporter substrate-binding protein [Gemmatimonadota bacterium]
MQLRHPAVGALGLGLLLTLGCTGADSGSNADLRPVVGVSIFPVADLVQTLVGEEVRVEVALPPGASPATFNVTPQQLRDLRRASAFFMIGGGLDEWLADLPEASGADAPIVRLSDGIQLLAEEESPEEEAHGHSGGSGNPHIWLDPILVRDEILPKLVEGLSAGFPNKSNEIGHRAQLLADSLSALDEEIRTILEPLEQRAFIATHSAWTYFAARYGLEEAGVIHAHPGQEPSSRDLAGLLDVARDHGIPCVFSEPQLGEVAVRAISTELSLPTFLLDPLGGPGEEGREGYFDLLRFNAAQLVKGLGGTRG